MADRPSSSGLDSTRSASPKIEVQINGSPTTPTTAAAETASSARGAAGGRNTSQKFASLRAAFEKEGGSGPVPDGFRNRLPSSDRASSTHRERNQDHDAEIAKLKEELAHEKELRTVYEERVSGLEENVQELNTRLEGQSSDVESRLDAIREEAKQHKLENTTLHQQLGELKRSISTSTRPAIQTADSTFEQEFGTLQYEAQNWVVNHFRKANTTATPEALCEKLESMGEMKHLDKLKPIYQRFEPAKKLAVYQATVACYLMEIFEEKYLFGMPSSQEWRKRIRKAAESLSEALSPVAYNRWRAGTFDAIRQSDVMTESLDSATNGITEMVFITLKAMTDIEDVDGKILGGLKSVIKRAVTLAHQIRVQQANYEFALPMPGEKLDPRTMESITVDDSEVDRDLLIYCATFPAVTKVGDEQGGNPGLRNIITKAKVLCDGTE